MTEPVPINLFELVDGFIRQLIMKLRISSREELEKEFEQPGPILEAIRTFASSLSRPMMALIVETTAWEHEGGKQPTEPTFLTFGRMQSAAPNPTPVVTAAIVVHMKRLLLPEEMLDLEARATTGPTLLPNTNPPAVPFPGTSYGSDGPARS